MYRSHEISSEVGCQQGDPLGPAIFCLAINPIIQNLSSDFNVWYLDDGTLGGNLETVLSDLSVLKSKFESIGLDLNYNSEGAERARLIAVGCRDAGHWLNAYPSPNTGTHLDGNTLRVAVGLRLGVPICAPHICHCGSDVDQMGRHGLSCQRSAGRLSRHAALNDIIRRSLVTVNVPAILEPAGIARDDGKRPDGMSLIPWRMGRVLVWDATCVAPSHLHGTTKKAGAAAEAAETLKRRKYGGLDANYNFIPFGVETLDIERAMKYCERVTKITDRKKLIEFINGCRGSREWKYVISFMKQLEGSALIEIFVEILHVLTNETNVFKAYAVLERLTGHADFDAVYEILEKISSGKNSHEIADFFRHVAHTNGVDGIRIQVDKLTGGEGSPEFPKVLGVLMPEIDLKGCLNLLISVTRASDLGEAIVEFNKILGEKQFSQSIIIIKKITGQRQFKYSLEELTHECNKLSLRVVIETLYKITGRRNILDVDTIFFEVFEIDNIVTLIKRINKMSKRIDALTFLESLLEITQTDTIQDASVQLKKLTTKKLSTMVLLEEIRTQSGHDDIIEFFRRLIEYTSTKSIQEAWEIMITYITVKDIFEFFEKIYKYTRVQAITFVETIMKVTNSSNFTLAISKLNRLTGEKYIIRFFEIFITISKKFDFEEVIVIIEEYTETTDFVDALKRLREATGETDIVKCVEYIKENKPSKISTKTSTTTTTTTEEPTTTTTETPTTTTTEEPTTTTTEASTTTTTTEEPTTTTTEASTTTTTTEEPTTTTTETPTTTTTEEPTTTTIYGKPGQPGDIDETDIEKKKKIIKSETEEEVDETEEEKEIRIKKQKEIEEEEDYEDYEDSDGVHHKRRRPGKPGKPGQPAQPAKPAKPAQPTQPRQPAQPSQPGQPGQPHKPSKPEQPGSTPQQPAQPSQPGQPGQPHQPSKPEQPPASTTRSTSPTKQA
ncbi:uncharacterized protein LOC134660067 [Cydia amplana]|uniref:uncharacterized protein LOC134660067 n=1 Tax=Cydia amplana TaxID=1869771 RepID=UPI002FE63BAB